MTFKRIALLAVIALLAATAAGGPAAAQVDEAPADEQDAAAEPAASGAEPDTAAPPDSAAADGGGLTEDTNENSEPAGEETASASADDTAPSDDGADADDGGPSADTDEVGEPAGEETATASADDTATSDDGDDGADAEAAGGDGSLADPANGEEALVTGPPMEPYENPELTDRERLSFAFSRFQELREAGMYDEAENAAKRAVELSITSTGPRSNQTAKALTNLALVQYDSRNYDAAQQNFESAIDIYKVNEDQLSARLVNPLRGLGAAQLESGRPDLAKRTYRQAVHITHVNEGPHNLDQMPILEALAETNLRMGELDAAKDAQDRIYALNIRHLDGNPMALIPSLMRRAAWQHRTGYVLDERATYRRVLRIIEDTKGKDDLDLIEPLTKLAQSYFYVDTTDPGSFQAASIATGEIYFKRAVRIAEENPESNWQILADSMLALADYYNFRSDQGRARRAYRDVWDLLSDDAERIAYRDEELGKLHVLNEEAIPQYIGDATRSARRQGDPDIREGNVVIAYDVSSRGRLSGLRIVDLTPPQFEDMESSVVREMRKRIYRPRFIDGEAADTTNEILTHRFFYEQSDLDERIAAATTGSDGA